ncbi:MAG: PD-(D/E)XK nuclease family protein, partial [Pirellulaceae bacterium]
QMPLVDPATGENLGVPLLGIIDLVLNGPEGAVIVDFKTAASASSPIDISHELQLSAYSHLWRVATGSTESELQIRSLVKTKMPQSITHRYPPREVRHFRRLFSVIREYLDALNRGQFNFRPGWTCGNCDYRDSACAAWDG